MKSRVLNEKEIKNSESYPRVNLGAIMPVPSQTLTVGHNSRTFRIDLDSGATVSFLRSDVARILQLKLLPNAQLALLADKVSQMKSLGEVDILVVEQTTQHVVFRLRALVVDQLGVECYGGQTFHLDNGIVGDVTMKTISFHNGKYKIRQSDPNVSPLSHPPPFVSLNDQTQVDLHTICAHPPQLTTTQTLPVISSDIVYTPTQTSCSCSSSSPPITAIKNQSSNKSQTIALKKPKCLLPAGSYEIKLNQEPPNKSILIMPEPPRLPVEDSEFEPPTWPPQICAVSNGIAHYINHSQTMPLQHPNNTHFRSIEVKELPLEQALAKSGSQQNMSTKVPMATMDDQKNMLAEIKVNRKIMSESQIQRLDDIFNHNLRAFDDDLTGGYDNKINPHEATFSFRKENKAPPYKVWVPQFNRKCQDLLQAKCDELEMQGVLADPKQHGVDIRHVSPCFIQQKARAKHKPLENCDLSEIRFITSYNVLNESIHPVPGRSKTFNDILMFLSRFKYQIFADLYNSYFQIKVSKKHWKYLAVMTPYRGLKVMTRCGQGLLNSDVELDQVLAKVLGDDITAGHCLAARDDLFVGGNTIDEALDNWNSVLTKIADNNLKVTARKVRVFLGDTEVFGHRISDGQVRPSDHTINTLAKTTIEELKTVRQVNGWKGLFKTLIRHMPKLAHHMSPFDTACGGKASSSPFDWSLPGILEAFNAATNQLQKVHETHLPNPEEQLYLLPDTSKSNLCTGWVLYTRRISNDGEKLLPVQYASAKLPKYMSTWCPCELEGVGAVLAIDQVRHWINESRLTTIVLPDNKPVVDAANMMKIGRHSKNARLQSLLTSVNRSNITFRHNSAKAGLHMVPDAASRLKMSCGSTDCQVERFLQDLPDKVQCMAIVPSMCEDIHKQMDTDPVVIASTTSELINLLESGGAGPIPFGSRQAWINIQEECNICRRFLNLKKTGQLPGRKDRDRPILNKMIKLCTIERGLIVSKKFDESIMKETDRTFVPHLFLPSILTVMHIKLTHPLASQLFKIFQKYFVAFNVQRVCEDLTTDCSLCISLARYPKELEHYNPQLVPSHPGSHMNVDVMQRASQKLLVNCDLFSGLTTACILDTEQREDMVKGILSLATPIRHCATVQIRVDRAPALKSLANNPDQQLQTNGIILDLGDHLNKNSNCSVDKKIQELENEIKRLCPKETKITSGLLSQAVTNLNNRIRNQGLSASQIHFSRDTNIGTNLHLDDTKLIEDKLQKRRDNHDISAQSKAPGAKKHTQSNIVPGQIVFARNDGTKHDARDPLLVTNVEGRKIKVQKLLHSHTTAHKSPKITSEVIVADEKFLYVPPHKRKEKSAGRRSSDDSWWRYPSPAKTKAIPHWTPTHRMDDYDDDDFCLESLKDSEARSDGRWAHDGDPREREDREDAAFIEEDVNEDIFDDQMDLTPDIAGLDVNLAPGPQPDEEDPRYVVSNEVDPNAALLDAAQADDIEAENNTDEEETDDENKARKVMDADNRCSEGDNAENFPTDPTIDQHRKPRKGDIIQAVINDYWERITLTSHENKVYPDYYNFRLNDGSQDGLYLKLGGSWTFHLSDSDEDDEDEEPHETERHNTALLLTDRLITPDTSDIQENRSLETAAFDDIYLDEDYSDQNSIFGSSNIEYMSNSFSSTLNAARHSAFASSMEETFSNDNGRAYSLVQRFNLEIPLSGNIQPNRVYLIPPHWRTTSHIARSRVTSASMSGINEAPTDPARPSAWARRILRLRKFIDRVTRNPFERWR